MPSTSVFTDTTFRTWPREMIPGHCFVWHKIPFAGNAATFYSIVLPTSPDLVAIGIRCTITYGSRIPYGDFCRVRQDNASWLLSQEQMTLARQLGWPQDDDTVLKLFSVPPT